MPIWPHRRVLVPLGMITGIAVGASKASPPAAPPMRWSAPSPLVEDLRDPDAEEATVRALTVTAVESRRISDRVAAVEQIARVPAAGWQIRSALRDMANGDAALEIREAARAALAEIEYEAKLRERTPRLGINPYRTALAQVRAQRDLASLRQAPATPPSATVLFRQPSPPVAAPGLDAPPDPPAPTPPTRIPAQPVSNPAAAPKPTIPAPLPPQFRSPPPAAKLETYEGPPTVVIPEPVLRSAPPGRSTPPAAIVPAAPKFATELPPLAVEKPTPIPVATPRSPPPAAAPTKPVAPAKPEALEPSKAKSLLEPSKIPADPLERRRLATKLLLQGREKLATGDAAGAERDAGSARELAVSFGRFEDSPTRLERDAARQRGVPRDAQPPLRRLPTGDGN